MPRNSLDAVLRNRLENGFPRGCRTTVEAELVAINSGARFLQDEVRLLQRRMGIGYEVRVKWLPGLATYRDGAKLAEEVKGDTILIYAEELAEAVDLVHHGFAEWMLNRHARPYRELVNKLITLFEDQQYQNKEKIVEALTKLM